MAVNPIDRFPSRESNMRRLAKPLAEQVREYFDQHPEVSRNEFLQEAVQNELQLREQSATECGVRFARWKGEDTDGWFRPRPPLSAEDIRLHAWLSERLEMLHPNKPGLWQRLRRYLLGDR